MPYDSVIESLDTFEHKSMDMYCEQKGYLQSIHAILNDAIQHVKVVVVEQIQGVIRWLI